MKRTDIRDLSYEELARDMERRGDKSFRAVQIFEWIYQKGVSSFEEMRTLPKELRQRLQKDFDLSPPVIVQKQVSKDGTTKLLFNLRDDEKIETVLIPASRRATVCVSTQAGCKFRCLFCASGVNGWRRDLTCAEILSQILYVKNATGDPPLSHIVFMGMGEPLDNYDHVLKAIRVINSSRGLHIAARRVTLSTCGLVPGIQKLAREGMQVELSVSLHGFDNESRNTLMPVNRKYPFHDLIKACKEYSGTTKRQITFEYILIKDLTCTGKAARALGRSLQGMLCKMNLIPYNPVKEFNHQKPSRQEILSFQNQLKKHGIHATLRRPRGEDISGACGQLRYASQISNKMA